MDTVDEEVVQGRRAFPVTQELFAGAAAYEVARDVTVGWYGPEVTEEEPGFVVVAAGGRFDSDEFIGSFLILTYEERPPITLYCLGGRALATDLAVSRRAFLALGLLTAESLTCTVEVRK